MRKVPGADNATTLVRCERSRMRDMVLAVSEIVSATTGCSIDVTMFLNAALFVRDKKANCSGHQGDSSSERLLRSISLSNYSPGL